MLRSFRLPLNSFASRSGFSAERLIFTIALLILAGWMATPARAAEDIVHFGSSIHVPKGATIQDAVCFFCSVNVQGDVDGDMVVFFGSVNLEGNANHDVVVFFGDVKTANDTRIGDDLVNFFGSVQLGENSTVGQDAVVMFGDLRTQSASIGGDRVVFPGWIFWVPFLFVCFGISFIVREIRGHHYRRYLRGF